MFSLDLFLKSEEVWLKFIQRMIFLSLNGTGIVGNTLILMKHMHTFVMSPEKKPIDLILIHLVFSNGVIICSTGVREIATVFYFRNFLGDVGCKIVIYLGRVARGLSICTTCLLSMVQAITISPRTSLWRKLKPQTAWQVLPYLLLFWIFNSLISSNLLQYITAVSSMNGSGTEIYMGNCYMLPSRQGVRWLFLSLMALRDVIFQSLMGWSSGHMAFHLYKHHQRVLYLHSSRLTHNSSPEIRATINTLSLMTCFLIFYWADFIFSFYIGSTLRNNFKILNIKTFVVLGYAVFSPLVLISRDICVAKSWRAR
ncbi:putative vomeronasal receptor-like protein 4 [Perognathus longimembris pacificus]|uniref:putative vomeronasal receptor-like protein 4 n=1 Tax=Perognathus longimembris pacificus TaxID=214514 RepID=UPI00201A0FF4|nr:putative vomeronasal receptor-like protein 4 [Perognathus longimembris pacificus]